MRVGIIGKPEVYGDDGQPLKLQPQQSRLLGVLTAVGGSLSSERLKEMMWDDAARADRSSSLWAALSTLRGVLGEDRVPPINRALAGDPECTFVLGDGDFVDLYVFRALVGSAEQAFRADDFEVAVILYRSALDLWADQLPCLPTTSAAQQIVEGLLREREDAYEALVDARLILGQHRELAREMPVVLQRDPLNEHLASLLMLAQYRSGRKAEAIRTFMRLAETVAEETGSEPGPVVQAMHQDILRNNPTLEWSPPPERPTDAAVLRATGPDNTHRHHRMTDFNLDSFGLGNGFHLAVDRAAVWHVRAVAPNISQTSLVNHQFFHRAIRTITKLGVKQIIEFHMGVPPGQPTHRVARSIVRDARVVYATLDPAVVAYVNGQLTDDRTGIFATDLLDPLGILQDPETSRLIDLSEPVLLSFGDVLNYMTGDDDPKGFIGQLMDALSSGSYLVAANGSTENLSDLLSYQVNSLYENEPAPLVLRDRDELRAIFEGYRLLDPGIVRVDAWRTNKTVRGLPMLVNGGVAVKE